MNMLKHKHTHTYTNPHIHMGEGREEKDTERDRECNSGCLEVWIELIDTEFKDNCFLQAR